jgi:carotenoid cleavage dioxygenase-like enzyme
VLVPRSGDGQPLTFEAKTAFAFHLLNAHESGDEVVVVGSRYPRFPGAVSFGEADTDKTPNVSVPYRWRLNTKSMAVKEEAIDDIATEFPRHSDTLVGQEVKFGYFGFGEGDFFDGVRKYDLATGKATDHKYGGGRFGGECVFVPKSGGKTEDDGWLLTYLFDKAADKSELVILDAADLKAKPVAQVHLPTRVPYGFHGVWVPGV